VNISKFFGKGTKISALSHDSLDRRTIFAWAHKIIGTTAQFLSKRAQYFGRCTILLDPHNFSEPHIIFWTSERLFWQTHSFFGGAENILVSQTVLGFAQNLLDTLTIISGAQCFLDIRAMFLVRRIFLGDAAYFWVSLTFFLEAGTISWETPQNF
jgi:hypothetical protein